jgi:RNA polymerase sigma-70 factor (ECF subfamily)
MDAPANEPSLDDQTVDQEHLRILRALVAQLPDSQRELLVLRYLLDWRITHIATHVGMAENTVSVTIRRTLQRLRRTWPHDQEEQP